MKILYYRVGDGLIHCLYTLKEDSVVGHIYLRNNSEAHKLVATLGIRETQRSIGDMIKSFVSAGYVEI